VTGIIDKSGSRTAYTIIELLTVMTIIIILIGIFMPSLNLVKRYARRVKQTAQFHAIDVAMELYNNEFEGYPDSDERDGANQDYCGALKLAEAMMGQDLLGFNPNSRFRSDCTDGGAPPKLLYDNPPGILTSSQLEESKAVRTGPYLRLDNANAYRLRNVYGNDPGDTDPFDKELFVLCDVYTNVPNMKELLEHGPAKIGMPILYYKVNLSGTKHDETNYTSFTSRNYYDYKDNHELVSLGMPFRVGDKHRLEEDPSPPTGPPEPPGYRFYFITKNNKIPTVTGVPYHIDSYILISAGFDGEYGTEDDVFNFAR